MTKHNKDKELITAAKGVAGKHFVTDDVRVGSYGAAVLSAEGNIYTGVTVNMPCDMGSCAEHNAIANMIAHKEYKPVAIVAVKHSGGIYRPCGRCREFIYQLNKEARVIIGEDDVKTVAELLPDPWRV